MKKHSFYFSSIVLFFLLLILNSCAPTRIIKPLQKGEKTIGGTFGGPLINFAGAVIPMPYTSVWGAYGVDSNATAWVGLHTTSLAFADLQMDFGFTKNIYASKVNYIPNISLSPSLNFLHSFRDAEGRLYPEIDLNFYWDKPKHLYYISSSNWFILSSKKAHNETITQHWLPTFNSGVMFKRPKTTYQLELRYLAPFNKNNSVVEYFNPLGSYGAWGIYFGINFKIK
jgi:hypothetical protein